jgi:hypothetical protein
MAFDIIDGKPVPAALAAELRAVKAAAGNPTLTSCMRTQAAVDFARAGGHQVSSQAELVELAKHGGNPANPVGQSTHELRSDGVAYLGPLGRKLAYWQVGTDWGTKANALRVVAAANARNWTATITYPTNPKELHHVNFRRKPVLNVIPILKLGSSGLRVARLRRNLYFIHDIDNGERYFSSNKGSAFTEQLKDAVKRFQRDHGQTDDGEVGINTRRQLVVAKRREHERRGRDPQWWVRFLKPGPS